ncbi:MAG: hypothetical protein KJ646_01470 [Nanoarchaeota archaeon]|nr:hypothetical protein [Nanoarchaeota archaeon]MBU4116204.1 hypothetical protein [Nanoarchaeota archaeon]
MKKNLMIIIGLVAIVLTIFLITQNPEDPVFFDFFGIGIFCFLFGVGGWILKTKKKTPDWIGFLILLIGILGLIVDGFIVIKRIIGG